jgi:hypothetical protein
VNIAENFHPSIPVPAFGFVRMMWQTHHPQQIADYLNTKYSLWGSRELDARAVENMKRRIDLLDRAEILGTKL